MSRPTSLKSYKQCPKFYNIIQTWNTTHSAGQASSSWKVGGEVSGEREEMMACRKGGMEEGSLGRLKQGPVWSDAR